MGIGLLIYLFINFIKIEFKFSLVNKNNKYFILKNNKIINEYIYSNCINYLRWFIIY